MFVKHINFMDVCIEVQSMQRHPNGTTTLHGLFWNMGAAESWPIGDFVKLTITRDTAQNWQQLTEPASVCLRDGPWSPLLF